MELTRSLVEARAAEYAETEPLYAVEVEQLEGLPDAFAAGSYGWRDAEWVVQWYYRRHLGEVPNDRRRALEAAYGENEFEDVREAIETAGTGTGLGDRLAGLTALSGVDVGVASAFIMFVDPDAYVVVGDREWDVLERAGELADPAPEPLTVPAYGTYLDACRGLAERFDCSLWTLYRACWRLGADETG